MNYVNEGFVRYVLEPVELLTRQRMLCEAYLEQGLVVTDIDKLRRNYMYTWQFPMCTPVSRVYLCHEYTCVTCTSGSSLCVHPCHVYTCVTNTPVSHVHLAVPY